MAIKKKKPCRKIVKKKSCKKVVKKKSVRKVVKKKRCKKAVKKVVKKVTTKIKSRIKNPLTFYAFILENKEKYYYTGINFKKGGLGFENKISNARRFITRNDAETYMKEIIHAFKVGKNMQYRIQISNLEPKP